MNSRAWWVAIPTALGILSLVYWARAKKWIAAGITAVLILINRDRWLDHAERSGLHTTRAKSR